MSFAKKKKKKNHRNSTDIAPFSFTFLFVLHLIPLFLLSFLCLTFWLLMELFWGGREEGEEKGGLALVWENDCDCGVKKGREEEEEEKLLLVYDNALSDDLLQEIFSFQQQQQQQQQQNPSNRHVFLQHNEPLLSSIFESLSPLLPHSHRGGEKKGPVSPSLIRFVSFFFLMKGRKKGKRKRKRERKQEKKEKGQLFFFL